MKRLAVCLGLALLAACNRSQPAEPAAQTAPAEPEPVPVSRAGPGTYTVTEIDGTKMTTVFTVDHTYTNTVHGVKTEAGAWAVVGGRTCLTPSEGRGAVARCYTDSAPGKDGSFIATPDRGDPLTIRKIA